MIELDGAPAVDVFTRYYGLVPEAPVVESPLAILYGEDAPTTFRAVFGVGVDKGALLLGGSIPTGF